MKEIIFPIFPDLVNIHSDIYKLDWSNFDKKLEEIYQDWCSNYWKYRIINNGKFVPILDDKWTKFIDREFKINDEYLKQLKHYKKLVKSESSRVLHFDTVVKERCLQVRENAVEVFFYLLSDCIVNASYDEKRLFLSVVLAKFWTHQTGRGLIEYRALLNFNIMVILNKEFKDYLIQKLKKIDESYSTLPENDPIVTKRKRKYKLEKINI